MESLVSAIIPTYNRQHFLREAIESVLQQDYSHYELIIVDDGSTDATRDLIAAYPVAQYLHQKNQGVSAARNRGIAHARGSLITFLDSDDLWLPHKLSAEVHLLEERHDVPVVYSDEIWIRSGRRVNPKKKHQKYSGMIFEHCLPLCIISPSSVMIRREILEAVGVFDESLPVCEDYDLWLRISAYYPIGFIEKPLIVKRGGHGDQLSQRYWGNDRFRVQALQKILGDPGLRPPYRQSAAQELIRKCRILENGFRKRRAEPEAAYYQQLINRYQP